MSAASNRLLFTARQADVVLEDVANMNPVKQLWASGLVGIDEAVGMTGLPGLEADVYFAKIAVQLALDHGLTLDEVWPFGPSPSLIPNSPCFPPQRLPW